MLIDSGGIVPGDMKGIETVLKSTGFFYDFEIEIALGLAEASVNLTSDICGYHWMKIYGDAGLIAFANYTRNLFSVHSWDLYWLAVHENHRHKKIGSTLLKAVEEDIRKNGGKILWLDTSGRPLYKSTEAFYQKNGYDLKASLKDFYAFGDPKQVYSKNL